MSRRMKDSGVEWIGEMPRDWKLAALKRFVVVNNGKEIVSECNETDDDAIPVYGSGGVFKHTNKFLHDGKAVMFGRKGTLGKPILVEGKFWTVDTMYFLTYGDSLLEEYSLYQLMVFDWESYATHTALPSIVASQIVSCLFPIPKRSEQRLIADYLYKKTTQIDAIIEKTRASIEEYKKLKQAIITQAVTKGVRGERKMKDSGIEWIGEIPEEYSIVRLKNVLSDHLQYGANQTGEPYSPDLPRYIRITDITIDGKLKKDNMLSLSEEDAEAFILEDNDVLFARSGATVGKAFIYKKEYGRAAFAGYLIKAKLKDSYYSDLLFLYSQSSIYEEWKKQIFIQSTIQNIGADRYYEMPIIMSPLDEQEEQIRFLDKECAEIDSLVKKKEKMITELESYKKSLIYEYVTGKKEVKA